MPSRSPSPPPDASSKGSRFLGEGRYTGWLPSLFLGKRLWRKTLGVVGVGRIGGAYARMLVEGHKMDLLYFDLAENAALEAFVRDYGAFLAGRGEPPVSCRRVATLEELLRTADVVSLHLALDESTTHMIDATRLAQMKEGGHPRELRSRSADRREALVAHCRRHPAFHAALDVFEHEPRLTPGLTELDNIVAVPHLGSATGWTRRGMATLAAANVAGILDALPIWNGEMAPFLSPDPPAATPSIVNADALGLPRFEPPIGAGDRAVKADG